MPPASRARMGWGGRTATWAAALACLAGVLDSAALGAQSLTVSVPPNFILPNYGRVLVGQREGIEAGAYVARTNDVAANWYNPAGLVKSKGSAINASATTYDWTRISADGLGGDIGRSRLSTIGTLFAGVIGEPVIKNDNVRLGFSMARPLAWRPSGLDARITQTTGDTTQQIDYAASVDFTTYAPTLAVGYAPGGGPQGRLRLGGAFGLWWTNLSQSQTVTARAVAPAGVRVVSRSFTGEGTVYHIVLIGGAQWDAAPGTVLGVRVVSPGLVVAGSTRLTYQATASTSAEIAELSFRDPAAEFRYELPLEVDAGGALRVGRGEVEVDVRYHGSAGSYSLYSSDSVGQLIQAAGGGSPEVTPVPFEPARNSARSVVSVAVGGNYLIRRGLRAHAGFATDPSPVDDQSASVFRKVDVNVATVGVSLTGAHLSGSIGLGFSGGTGVRDAVDPVGDGSPVQTRLRVQSVNLLYALTYTF